LVLFFLSALLCAFFACKGSLPLALSFDEFWIVLRGTGHSRRQAETAVNFPVGCFGIGGEEVV
jgi:mannose-6-phosphate isomerase-like protein (cupin superfamily)